jgi:hypothetical protein
MEKYPSRYQAVVPIGHANAIAYFTPRNQDERRRKKKEKAFEGILQKQLRERGLEENQTFQLYC